MSNTLKFVSKLYLIIVSLFILKKAVIFFGPQSPVQLYFYILNCFNPLFFFLYMCNYLQLALSLIHIIPLALYIHRLQIFPEIVWQYLFILKIIFDICGNSYHVSYLVSLYHYSPLIAISAFLSSIAIYLPMYWVCYNYAFKSQKLSLKSIES